MRKLLLLLIISTTCIFAQSKIFLGAECLKRVYIGYVHNQFFGLFIKHSIFKQDLDLQQVEFNPYMNYSFSQALSFRINPYFGMRYDTDFYYLGARFSADWTRFRYFQLKTEFSPHYHSRDGYTTLFESQIRSFILPSVGLALGAKNKPEYNRVEKRIFGGLVIKDSHSQIEATISTPYNLDDTQLTRFNISFQHAIDL